MSRSGFWTSAHVPSTMPPPPVWNPLPCFSPVPSRSFLSVLFTLSANSGAHRVPTGQLSPATQVDTAGFQHSMGQSPWARARSPVPLPRGQHSQPPLTCWEPRAWLSRAARLQDKQQGRKAGFLHLVGTCEVRAQVRDSVCTEAPTTPRSQVSPSAHPPLIPAARPGRESNFCLGAVQV